jgi:hypothetical protein
MKNCFPLFTSSIIQGALVGAGSLWPINALESVGLYTVTMAVLGAVPIDAFFNYLKRERKGCHLVGSRQVQ